MPSSEYQVNWDNYWSALFEDQDTAFWDVPAQLELEKGLAIFKEAFDPGMPLIDFGCGNGTQSAVLAEHFAAVIGVDVSSPAIAEAQSKHRTASLRFEVLDATDPAQAIALHDQMGDANIYIRGVLHQIQAGDRPAVMESIKILMGKTGQLFLIELSPTNKERFSELSQIFDGPPPQLARVFQQGINPADITPECIVDYFPGSQFSMVKQGQTSIQTNTNLPDGTVLVMPAFYMLIHATKF